MCFCIKITVIIDLHHRLLHCQSWWVSLLLLELLCAVMHLCVVAVPIRICFQCLPLNICILQHRGIATCSGDNVCIVCHAYPAALVFFCVMCWYLPVWSCDDVLNCIHNQILALNTKIFANVFQFLFFLASDAIQAFISYQDVITSIYLKLSRFSPIQG